MPRNRTRLGSLRRSTINTTRGGLHAQGESQRHHDELREQGSGEPLVLIPYLAADNACYAFQVADYAKHFTCISIDPRGAGETDKPDGTYSTELFADDVAAFMAAIGVERAHVSGLSLGAATGLWLGAKYPETRQVAVAAQLLDQDRPVPKGGGRRLADRSPRGSAASPR